MNDDELTHIEALLAAATPGPWAPGSAPCGRYVCTEERRGIYANNGTPVGECRECGASPLVVSRVHDETGQTYHVHQEHIDRPFHDSGSHDIHAVTTCEAVAGNYDYEEGGIVHERDTAAIIALRNAAPALLEELRRLRALRDAAVSARVATDTALAAWHEGGADCSCPIAECPEHVAANAAMGRAERALNALTAAERAR